jgi:hypothetical protein
VLAAFEREPELIDVVALHLLDRDFAPDLHEEILEVVDLELGTPVATRRRDMAFRAAVLEACLAAVLRLRLLVGPGGRPGKGEAGKLGGRALLQNRP